MADSYKWDKGNIRLVNNEEEIKGQQSLSLTSGMNVGVVEEEDKPEVIGDDKEGESLALDLIKGGRFDVKTFHEKYEENTRSHSFCDYAIRTLIGEEDEKE